MTVDINLSERRWSDFFEIHEHYKREGRDYTNEELVNKILADAVQAQARYYRQQRAEAQ